MTPLKFTFGVAFCCMAACIVTAQTINDTKTLMEDHLQGYNKYVRPVADQSDAVDVQISLCVLSIQDFDEVQETLSVVGYLNIRWDDASMVWDPKDYNGVYGFRASYKDVWVPEMILTNPAQAIDTIGDDWQRVYYYRDGSAFWSPGFSHKTTCSVNMLYFPFDTQECDITFNPWGYSHGEITTFGDDINFQFYAENGAWSVSSSSTRSAIRGASSEVTFKIKIKRKPGFVVVNVLLPILFLSLINVLVFILPVESGERVSYCITVLLSIAVFMTIVSDTLPRNTEPIPIIAFILMLEMTMSSLTTLIAILNIKMYYKPETSPVPTWIQRMVQLQRFNCKRRVSDQTQENQVSDATAVNTIVQDLQTGGMKVSEDNRVLPHIMDTVDQDTHITWRDVSEFLDRLAFFLLLSATVLSFAIFLVVALSSG